VSDTNATEAVARQFVAAGRGVWIQAPDTMAAGGLLAWRTEISRCRKYYGMDIINRVTRRKGEVLRSEYCLLDRGYWPSRKPVARRAA
jgi:hypothetical protein